MCLLLRGIKTSESIWRRVWEQKFATHTATQNSIKQSPTDDYICIDSIIIVHMSMV